MKVLYVGEGRHDIGRAPVNPFQPRVAAGPIPVLVRKIQPAILEDSPALAWSEIHRFQPKAIKPGYPSKVPAAILLAERKFGCEGCILIADRDRDADRRDRIEQAVDNSVKISAFRIAVGVAVESIEAWTLGVPATIAKVLGVDENEVRQKYPGAAVEELYEKSGKEEHRPKQLMKVIASLNNEADSLEFRTRIAEETNLPDLDRACPLGFAPFAAAIRKQFGAPE